MNAVALARLDDPLAGSKHALRRSGFPCILASGLTSLQPSNDVGEKSSSYDEHAPGSLFWTQKDPIRFNGHSWNIYEYAGDDPINRTDWTGKDPASVAICEEGCAGAAVLGFEGCLVLAEVPPALAACELAVAVGGVICEISCATGGWPFADPSCGPS